MHSHGTTRRATRHHRSVVASGVLGFLGLAIAGSGAFWVAQAQSPRHPAELPTPTPSRAPIRTRLILKDGSYQTVLSYQVVGAKVRYRSAERNGDVEEVPLVLVDLPATERYKREHDPTQPQAPVVLSPELLHEEAERAARTPEIAPDLHLPEDDSVLALDAWQGTPELVPLPQQGSDLNKETAHTVTRLAINPASSPHRLLDLPGQTADVQLHVPDPVFYVRLSHGDDDEPVGPVYTVDTRSAPGRPTPSGGDTRSDYVLERLDVRRDSRQVDSLRLQLLGSGHPQPDIIELKAEPLPGGRWLKLTPTVPLTFGEYGLLEIVGQNDINRNVWDFGVHPTAGENIEAQRPEPKRKVGLGRH